FCKSGDANGRIVTIELLPVSSTEGRPKVLQGPKRNNFFDLTEGRPIKITPRSEKYRDQYFDKLQIVAADIKDGLQEMRRKAGASVHIGKKVFPGTTVLLAEREDDVQSEWESIRGMLLDFGAMVLPADGGYPSDEAEFSRSVDADIE